MTFTKEALLGAMGTCAASRSHTFRERAAALDAAVKAYAAAPGAPTQMAAREAFSAAMDAWQTQEVLQYGPSAPSTMSPGGKDLRDHIYAWPQFGRCAVEEGVLAKVYESATFGNLPINRRGLTTLEYLLFYEGSDTACTTSTDVTMWNALSVEERSARKLSYAAAASADVLKRAITLDEAWDPAKGNFVQTLKTPGAANPVYTTMVSALQAVGLGPFYLDWTVKQWKLDEPLNTACTTAACLESPYSARAKANIRLNLEAARLVLEGCEAGYAGLGFDDLLASINQAPLAATLRTQLLAAEAALDAIEEADLSQAFARDVASVQALRAAVANLTTTLKTTFVMVLGFQLAPGQTDNDT
jgi:predicted lipoprotein